MGNCFGSPKATKEVEKKYKPQERTTPSNHSKKPADSVRSTSSKASAAKSANQIPDFGLGDLYEAIKLLGRGGEGETWLCRDKSTDEKVAIKLIRRPIPKAAITIIKREIKIQADLGQGHLNIVHADEVVLTKSHLGLVMEYVPGGNMVNYVTKKRETKAERGGLCLTEDEARYYFKQLISAVEYCHGHNVAHRDLKLDNTLLDSHDPPYLKLCDFGFAKHWIADENMNTMRIGTPEYMGPELISSRTGYDGKKVDVWASGVLLFVMLLGMFPFETQDEGTSSTVGLHDIWLQQIKTSWRDNPNNNNAVIRLTPECRDLLDKMFDVRANSRLGVDGIKSHPWFTKPLPEVYRRGLEELNKEQQERDKAVEQGNFRSVERDKALEAIIDRSAHPALPTEETQRVSLSKIRRQYTVLNDKQIPEDE